MARYILGIDQGTTVTKAVIFDHDARIISSAAIENQLFFPRPGWVEQDPDELLDTTIKVSKAALTNSRISLEDIDAIGISNQLSTTIFWNKYTGEAVGRAISWQDIRNLSISEKLSATLADEISLKTGARIFPNNTATKILWLMEHDKSIQRGISRGELLFGTVDTWLIWKLSSGAAHVTDLSNMCLSLLLNIYTVGYDDQIIRQMNIPYEILPELRSSSEIYAYTDPNVFLGARLPIAGDIGDQFSAVFGQACFDKGEMVCNIGTGSSLTLNTGNQIFPPGDGVDSPILWSIENEVVRAIGSWSNASGAAIQWLRDELGIIHDLAEAEVMAYRVPDTQGVYFVPAFTGLGSPFCDPYARGSFFGITQGTSKNHLVRAALEGMAFQIKDSYEVIKNKFGGEILNLSVSGGGSKNDFLLQFLSDIVGIPVKRSVVYESSVLGAAFMAGLATGYWESMDEIRSLVRIERQFEPHISQTYRDDLYQGWTRAINRTIGWLQK
jgi:glycerol kinase